MKTSTSSINEQQMIIHFNPSNPKNNVLRNRDQSIKISPSKQNCNLIILNSVIDIKNERE